MSKDLTVIKQAIRQTNEQGEHLIQVVDHVEEIETKINAQYIEIKDEFENFRQTVTLQNSEIEEISEMVRNKTTELTRKYFDEYLKGKEIPGDLFGAKYGHLIMGMYQSLKDYFDVTSSYKLIKHKDYDRAVAYIKTITLNHLRPHYLRLTDNQKSLLKGE